MSGNKRVVELVENTTLSRPVVSTSSTTGKTSFTGRWRVALRYGARDAWRNKGRTALVGLMVLIPIAVATFLVIVFQPPSAKAVVANVLGPQLAGTVEWMRPDAIYQDISGVSAERVNWPDEEAETTPQTVPVAVVDEQVRSAMPTELGIVPFLEAVVQVEFDGEIASDVLQQTDLGQPAISAAVPVSDGTAPGAGQIALSRLAARQLGAEIGDVVTVIVTQGEDYSETIVDLEVSGIRRRATNRYEGSIVGLDGPLRAPADFSTQWRDNEARMAWHVVGESPITWDDVRAANNYGLRVTSRSVILDPPPADQIPPMRWAQDPFGATRPRGQIVAAIAAVVMLEVVLLIGPAFAVSTRRSARSLALIAANGGDRKALSAVVIGLGLGLGLVATAVGMGLGVLGSLAVALFVPEVGLQPAALLSNETWLLLPLALLGVLATTLAAWLPARGAAKVDVATALSGRRSSGTLRRRNVAGSAALSTLGLATALLSAYLGQMLAFAAGVVAGLLGLVLFCGPLVAALGRLADRLPLAGRFALRDAARNRTRTAPATAAVLVATAGAVAALIHASSAGAQNANSDSVIARAGVVSIAAGDVSEQRYLSASDVARIKQVVSAELPELGEVREVPVVWQSRRDDSSEESGLSLAIARGVDRSLLSMAAVWPGAVVDDGDLLDALAIPDAAAARAALAAGRILVSPWELFDDGTAHVRIFRANGYEDVWLPAAAVGALSGPDYNALPIIPASVAAAYDLPVQIGGLLAEPGTMPTRADFAALNRALTEEFGRSPGSGLGCAICAVDVNWRERNRLANVDTMLMVGGAVLIAVAAAWIASALAATESRPDLATMSAVGAAPATRKRFVAQAGTIAVIGASLGVLAGGVVGTAFVLYQRYRQDATDYTWTVVVPWPRVLLLALVVPLLAILGAWVATRSRETLTRRA